MILSVALCTYNGGKFLGEQLESIIMQSLSVDEIIICDDCSNDNTIELIHFYQNKYPGLIHLYQNKQSLGTIKNFENAISLTTGDLIFLADQDDIWHSDKVKIMSSFFADNKECKLLFTDGELIDENGIKLNSTLWEKWDFNEELRALWKNNILAFKDLIINKNKITGATVCFHKALKNNILPIELPYGYWHDGWLGLHVAAINGLFFIENTLIQYRIHGNQQIGLSNNVLPEITVRANKKFISIDKYFLRLRKMYPNLKEYVPTYIKRNLIQRLFLKLRFILINEE